jgi:hypothetical protein
VVLVGHGWVTAPLDGPVTPHAFVLESERLLKLRKPLWEARKVVWLKECRVWRCVWQPERSLAHEVTARFL